MTGPWVKQGDGTTGGIFRLACHNKPSMVLIYKKCLPITTGEGVKNQARMPGYGLCKDTVPKRMAQKDDRPGGGSPGRSGVEQEGEMKRESSMFNEPPATTARRWLKDSERGRRPPRCNP